MDYNKNANLSHQVVEDSGNTNLNVADIDQNLKVYSNQYFRHKSAIISDD
jgi:hypothetical protein